VLFPEGRRSAPHASVTNDKNGTHLAAASGYEQSGEAYLPAMRHFNPAMYHLPEEHESRRQGYQVGGSAYGPVEDLSQSTAGEK
jgi:hypothetical protein